MSQERLKIEVKLLLSANKKSYRPMPRGLAQQRMTLSDLGCLKSASPASRAISAVAELFLKGCRPLDEACHFPYIQKMYRSYTHLGVRRCFMRNFQMLIVISAVKVCKQCLQTASVYRNCLQILTEDFDFTTGTQWRLPFIKFPPQ